MVKWSAVYWLSMVFSVITYLLGGEAKSELFYCHLYASPNLLVLEGYSLCNMPKYVDFSVLGLQSDFSALGVQIKI